MSYKLGKMGPSNLEK